MRAMLAAAAVLGALALAQPAAAQPAAAQPAAAQPAADDIDCRNGSFPTQDAAFGLAVVTGAPRTYLRADTGACPDDGAACRGRGYVVPGNTVLTGRTARGFVCVFFPNRGGGSAGYVRPDEIKPLPTPAPPLSAWLGTWTSGDDAITLRRAGDALAAKGEAYWPSANPSLRERPGGPNLGEMGGQAVPRGNTATFAGAAPDECRVTLTLLPPILLVRDNGNCGGFNVRFLGVYGKH